MNAGDISITLSIDGKDMQLQLKNAGVILRQFQGTVEKTASSVKRLEDQNSSLATKFRNLVLTLGNLRFALLDIYDVFLRLPQQILTTAGELERIQQLMVGLSTQASESARKAEAALNFDYLIDTARNAPFALESLSEAFVKLKTAGIDPTDGSMRTLVDSIAKVGGTSENLKRAAIAIQQMAGKGVISMEELRQQLGEAVPEAMNAMAAGMGLTMAQLSKIISTGTLEANSAIEKMLTVLNLRNRGSAEAMMETWVGALARLQTEWQIAAKTIAEGGFGEEAVAIVNELSTILQTQEFKRFATDVGKGLGDAIRAIAEGVKILVEYKDLVLALVGGLASLKVATGIIAPAITRINELYKDGVQRIGAYRTAIREQSEALQVAKASEIEAQRNSARAAVDAANLAIAKEREKIRAIQAANAQMLAETRSVQANMAKVTQVKPGIFVLGDPAAERRIAQLNTLMERNNAIVRQSQAEIQKQAAASRVAAAAVATHNGQIVAMEAGLTKATLATRALTAAQTAGQFIWGAIGGWIGAVTIALTVGALAWLNYKNAVAEADARLRRLRQGVADAGDAKEFEGRADQALAEIGRLEVIRDAYENAVLSMGDGEAKNRAAQDLEVIKAQIRDQQQVYAAEMARAGAARRQAAEQQGREEADAVQRQLDETLEAIRFKGKQETLAQQEAFQIRKREAQGNQAELEKIALEEQKYLSESGKRFAQQVSSELIEVRKRVAQRQDLSAEGKTALLKRLDEQIIEARKEALSAEGLLNAIVTNKVEGAGPVTTPIQTYIRQLEEDRARLQVTLAGLASNMKEANSVEEALAEFQAKAKAGFRYKEKSEVRDASEADKAQARQLTAVVAANEAVVDYSKKVTDKYRQIEPDYQAALRSLANPLGNDSTTGRSNQIAELASQLRDVQAAIASATLEGVDTDPLRQTAATMDARLAELRDKAATVDLASINRAVVESNRQLGIEVLETDRERQQAQLRAENDVAEERIRIMLKLASEAGLSAEQTALIEDAAAQNRILRLRQMELESRSPMQRMLDDWKDKTGAMEQATAQWVDRSVEAIARMVETGKLDFKSLAESIIADLIRIQIKAQAVDILGSAGGGSGLLGDIISAVGSFFFAKGGIMTSSGPMQLRKYAAGGIANSPQLALFGEGSTPEAYVPLPDGRTIPVTMKSSGGVGQAPDIEINIINQSGERVAAENAGARFDGRKMILDVVLTAAAQPGPFRDGMRNMMGAK